MLSRRPVHRIKAMLLLFPLDISPFNEAQRRRRPRLFSEALLMSNWFFWAFTMASAATRLPIEPIWGQKLTPGAIRSIDIKLFSLAFD